MKYWMRDSTDNQVEVSWNVAHLKRHPPKWPMVVLLGGSSVRSSVSSESSLASEVTLAGGPQIISYTLASSGQSFAESMAIIDNLPDTPTTVMLGIYINRFSHTRAKNFQQVSGNYLFIESAALRNYFCSTYGKKPPPFGLLSGVMMYIATYPYRYLHEVFEDISLRNNLENNFSNAEMNKQYVRMFRQYTVPKFDCNFEHNALLLMQIVKHCKNLGFDVVLLEMPINSEVIGNTHDIQLARMRRLCRNIAETYNVSYLNFNDQLLLSNTAFRDINHLNKDGSAIYKHELAENLAALYNSGAIRKKKK